jgi:hypothetical protein
VRPEWKAIMNTDVEDLLREGMERFTRDLRAPAGMTRRAARRRRWRLGLRSVAGVAALTAGAVVAVAAVEVPGARHTGTEGPAVPAAYMLRRVDSALNAAEPGEIAQMTVTTRGAAIPGGKTITAEEWSYGDQWRSVRNTLAGHPLYDQGFRGSSVYTLVSYLTQTWARHHELGKPAPFAVSGPRAGPGYPVPAPKAVSVGHPKPGPNVAIGPRGCVPGFAALPVLFRFGLPGAGFAAGALPTTVAKDLRTAVACGALAVAGGRKRVDGVEAIELTSRRNSPISETIWVSPGTDLPVRVVVRSAPGTPDLRQTANITWLPPTAQNLAKLTVPIPAGFRRVPLAKAIAPIKQQVPGEPLLGPAAVFCAAPAGPACLYQPGAAHPGHTFRIAPYGQPLKPR